MPDFPLFQSIFIYGIPILFAITVHEVAHGWVASKRGDQTARMLGRLTLNPLKHIHPVGTVIVPAILVATGGPIFGWAKPVPVDWRNLRRPKQDMAWVALAGPGANLMMFVIWAAVVKLIQLTGGPGDGPVLALYFMAIIGIIINAVLMIFNMVPIPPLDGSRVMSSLLPPKLAYRYNQLERFGIIIVISLLLVAYYTGYLNLFFIKLQSTLVKLLGL